MDRKRTGEDDDAQLFRQAIGDVKPLAHDLADIGTPRPAPIPLQRMLDEREVLREMATGGFDGADIETGEELIFSRPGVQHTVFRRLRRGLIAVEGELDLHGFTVVEARRALLQFLHQAQAAGQHCVRVVHGKGHGSRGRQPILKGKVNLWLRQVDAVLAFCSTRPVDGGTGAVYVLLKRASG